MNAATKTIEESFIDWESNIFGFGYGSGEEHTLAALKAFMGAVGRNEPDMGHSYEYQKLEVACGPQVAWLLINRLAHHSAHIIEYGTSPRFGWLTPQGVALKAFVDSKTVDEMVELCCSTREGFGGCGPDVCNCGPSGYEEGRKCLNPFWVCR